MPEESSIDLLSQNPGFIVVTQKMGQEIVNEFAREQYIFGLLEKITKQTNDPVVSIQNFVTNCLESQINIYNAMFVSKTKTGQEVHENEALVREVLNHVLGAW